MENIGSIDQRGNAYLQYDLAASTHPLRSYSGYLYDIEYLNKFGLSNYIAWNLQTTKAGYAVKASGIIMNA